MKHQIVYSLMITLTLELFFSPLFGNTHREGPEMPDDEIADAESSEGDQSLEDQLVDLLETNHIFVGPGIIRRIIDLIDRIPKPKKKPKKVRPNDADSPDRPSRPNRNPITHPSDSLYRQCFRDLENNIDLNHPDPCDAFIRCLRGVGGGALPQWIIDLGSRYCNMDWFVIPNSEHVPTQRPN